MHTTNTSVLTRRVWIRSDYATLPYEAGWATEAVFFTQVEGEHPDLTITTDISPDGINWIARGEPRTLGSDQSIAESSLTTFGNWVRLRVEGASEDQPARILVHVNLKG
ncbi:hypothetical protein ARHIZOSPH14_06780 [Agromyces rhizosphaerae]|uniref:DUF6385 domain-containing protein n=1 Tax=Agromyces rhizosphaerae TaxID=88374 RepID=A0A9W6CUR7_9MICO|nr:DUF6385 domain-containing protein [Agromyces rhizosphaerae]GLI26436.1 hypothetical protein ARHIZOSPH14_06780 [Agromyces rhizosphaerae]